MKTIPRLNASYWVLILICTTMGELIGNLFSRNFELGYAQGALMDICIFAAMIFLVMFFKFKNDIFYWLLILMGNVGGTNLADWVTLEPLENDKKWGVLRPLQLGTRRGSLAVLGALILVLAVRYWFTKKRGDDSASATVFYWIAILLSSTFGTTSGDFITNDTPFGALGGSILLLVLLAVVYVLFKKGQLSKMTAYWFALVLMHPVGATIGNYVSKPIGLNLGNVYTNIALVVMFAVIYFFDVKSGKPDSKV